MSKLPVIKSKELVRFLKRDGFIEAHRRGSHVTYKHPNTNRRVTVSIHGGEDLKKGTLRGIVNDLGLSVEEFLQRYKN